MLNDFKMSLRYSFITMIFYLVFAFILTVFFSGDGGGGDWFFMFYIIPSSPIVFGVLLFFMHFVILNPYTGLFNEHLLQKKDSDDDIKKQ